jgi:hypothetical protein
VARNQASPLHDFDPIGQFQRALSSGPPWESIVDFATHKSYCGRRLYPKQLTLLKLIYLETDQMTQFDLDTIETWREGFKDRTQPMGVPPDIWDRVDYLQTNGYHHFMQVQNVGGRRGSKGIIGGILGAERMAYLYSLDDWQAYYQQVPNQVAEVTVVATSQSQAARRQFRDIRNTVMSCEYLKHHIIGNKYTEFSIRTPGDERRIAEMKLDGVNLDYELATIYATAAASASTSGRGGSGLVNMYDEMAHMIMGTGSTKTGEEIYDSYQPSLDQFGSAALTYIPSSPYSQVGKFYELYKTGTITLDVYNEREGKLEMQTITEKMVENDAEEEFDARVAEPTWLTVQLPSWDLYEYWETSHTIPMRPNRTRCFPKWNRPVQYRPDSEGTPDERVQYRRKIRNPAKFGVERGAQFATVEDAYLDPAIVDRMFAKPWWRSTPVEQDRGKFSILYRGHGDPGRSNANFGFAIGHIEEAPCNACGWTVPTIEQLGKAAPAAQQSWKHECKQGGVVLPHVIIDKLKVWKPEDYPDHQIDYYEVGQQIEEYLDHFPSMGKMSYDQWNSAGFISSQKRSHPQMRIVEVTFTPKENQDRFEKFKSALGLNLVHSYKDTFFEDNQSLLELELKFLQEKNGKVDKQEIGPVQTKDLSDAVMVVVTDLLHDKLDRWYSGRNRVAAGSTYAQGLKSGAEFERMAVSGVMAPGRQAAAQQRVGRGRSSEQLAAFRASRANRNSWSAQVARGRNAPPRSRFGRN